MSSVLQAGPCVRTNQLDFDEEVVFKAQQYLFDHIREDGDQPFCLTVSMTHPHDPYTIPKPFWDLYRDEDIPLPQNLPAQADLDPHSQRLLKVYDLWDKPLPEHKIRDARRAYFGACSYIDSNVGKLLQTLEDTGLADDTIIVFSGDHGDMLGERGLWYKMHWFEMSARVPLLVYAPGQFKAGRVSAAVSTADLLPTFVELAGGALEQGLALDGRSLVGHLRGEGGHDEVFGEYMAEGTVSPLMMIRRGQWKFIYSEQDPCLLFDLHNDPQEREDLARSPDHQGLFNDFLSEARSKWDIPVIHQQVLASQRRRRFVAKALSQGKLKSWDHQPLVDASQQYMRNHIDLDDLERKARYPQPCQ
jgi:choline-sulfatase